MVSSGPQGLFSNVKQNFAKRELLSIEASREGVQATNAEARPEA
jgi:hypothetical protein